jgi:hypothetical protein
MDWNVVMNGGFVGRRWRWREDFALVRVFV